MTTPSGMRINQVGSSRQVVSRRGDRTVVTNSSGHGFVQREVVVRNQRFVQRTYYVSGVRYAHVYRPYVYRGVVVNVYTPVRYYRPGFYVYAYNPWRAPVYYQWGWANDPWYGVYGRAYFAPYPFYAGPSLWLTDYVIANSFREAYQAGVDAGANMAAANNYAPMGDDVKRLVSDEVRRQLEWQQTQVQQQDAQNGPPISNPLADQRTHTLIANSSLNADAGGQECAVTEGDVLQYDSGQPTSGPNASATVLWSKPEDCRSGSVITVPVEQVQEMENHMLENLNQGLQVFQTQQGQNGLPKLAPNLNGSTQAPFAGELPPPDPNVETELKEQAQEADSAVSQVTEEARQAWAPPPSPPPQPQVAEQPPPDAPVARQGGNVTKGMSIDTVRARLGPPTSTISDGKKTILIYSNLKITFEKGKVHKVE